MPRGRPKKPPLFPWLNDPPEWIRQFPLNNAEGIREFIKQETERLRRETVSEAIRAAYKDGKNVANADRLRKKTSDRLDIAEKFKGLIATKMSAASVAAHIKKNNPEIKKCKRTLWQYVTEIRNLAEPYRGQK